MSSKWFWWKHSKSWSFINLKIKYGEASNLGFAERTRWFGRWKTYSWTNSSLGQKRKDKGYFNNIIKELKVEDRFGFREMFRMDISDFESVLAQIDEKTGPKERLGGIEPLIMLLYLYARNKIWLFLFLSFEFSNVKKFERHSILYVFCTQHGGLRIFFWWIDSNASKRKI